MRSKGQALRAFESMFPPLLVRVDLVPPQLLYSTKPSDPEPATGNADVRTGNLPNIDQESSCKNSTGIPAGLRASFSRLQIRLLR
jgi:hypothetical protein